MRIALKTNSAWEILECRFLKVILVFPSLVPTKTST